MAQLRKGTAAMQYHDLYFEDFTIDRRFETGERTIGEAEIISFGESYAPLPYHIDPEAAKESMFGGLVAAGFQTTAISFGLFIGCGIFDSCAMGSPGLDRLRWRRPVRPGDRLRVSATVMETSPAGEGKTRNFVKFLIETYNQDDEIVLEAHTMHYVRGRPAAE